MCITYHGYKHMAIISVANYVETKSAATEKLN
jgi:hypothetical protein